jgi:hypothetical protein
MCTLIEQTTARNLQPKAATHTMRFDILNIDGTVKRIEIEFCKSDQWSQAWSDPVNIANMFLPVIYEQIIDADKLAFGCKTSIINKTTNLPVWDVYRPYISKQGYIANL